MELKKIFNEKNYEKLLLIRNKKTEDYYKVLLEQCHKIVTDCLKTVDRSKLKPITTANTYFTEIYNNFVNNKTNPYDLENKRIIGLFAEMIYFSMSMYEFLKKNKRNPFKIMLIEKCIRMESMMDSKTGNNILFSISPEYEFELRSTKTIPFKTESGHETYKVIEVENAPYKDSIKKEQLVFKTGNLLISDWFRIDEFTNTVKADRYISLNSEVGIEESIKHYIQKHGFISVNVGNTCPEILYRSGKIICGNMTDKKAKMVCTDLWAVTVIEEELLLDILVKNGLSKKQAIKELKEMECIKMKVPPGKYELNYCANYKNFSKKYKTKNKNNNLRKGEIPFFTIEKVSKI